MRSWGLPWETSSRRRKPPTESICRTATAVPPGSGIGKFASTWAFGFNLNWELDFWGQFRRAIASADDNLDASVEGYDAAILTMLGDVASDYVQIRTDQEQIRLLKKNEVSQNWVYEYFKKRYAAGFGPTSASRWNRLGCLAANTSPDSPIGNRLAAGQQRAVYLAGHTADGPARGDTRLEVRR